MRENRLYIEVIDGIGHFYLSAHENSLYDIKHGLTTSSLPIDGYI